MSFSQEYYPLIEENRTWNVISVALVGPHPWDTTYSTLTYEFSGDTIIGSHTYLKLYESNEEVPANWNLWCYMREDSDKRIWYRKEAVANELLMYDFSIKAGDSVLVGLNEQYYLFVDSISQISINETDRKKYWFSCKIEPEYNETWIEGIGSSKGICWGGSAFIVGGWYWFLCMSVDENLIYLNPNYESCYLITGINEIENTGIQIYPNPAHNFLRIENSKDIMVESISITNINGQIIEHFEPEQTHINTSGIPPGLYLLKIAYANGILIEKVILR
jgi:hypothetical protein